MDQRQSLRASRLSPITTVLSFVALLGCSTLSQTPTDGLSSWDHGQAQGQWKGKVLVTDKKQNNTVSIDIIAVDHSRLRVELTTGLGIYLGSIALRDNQMEYFLAREHKYYQGEANAESFSDLLRVRLEPKVLYDLLFDRDISQGKWHCQKTAAPLTTHICTDESADLQISSTLETGALRRTVIQSKTTRVEMLIEPTSSKVELNNKTFVLDVPETYKP